MNYLFHILILWAIYSILAMSLDLLVGHTGILSLAHGAFYGIGAYTSALLAVTGRVPFAIAVLAAMVCGCVVSFIVSLPSLRLHEDYFVVATFGFQMILFSILNNWGNLTQGPLGITGIPKPVLFGWNISSRGEFLMLSLVFAALAYFIVYRLASSPFGRVLRAIREDEVLAKALGKNTFWFKVTAFAVSAALAASAGSLYAQYMSYIDPTSFTVMESILIISMVIIGGAGSILGPLVGALLLVTVPEGLRFIGLPASVAANLRQIFYGGLLVAILIFRPNGMIGRYRLGR